MTDIADLHRAAKELEKKTKACSDVKSYKVEVIPDDMKIVLTAHLVDGRKQKRIFRHK